MVLASVFAPTDTLILASVLVFTATAILALSVASTFSMISMPMLKLVLCLTLLKKHCCCHIPSSYCLSQRHDQYWVVGQPPRERDQR